MTQRGNRSQTCRSTVPSRRPASANVPRAGAGQRARDDGLRYSAGGSLTNASAANGTLNAISTISMMRNGAPTVRASDRRRTPCSPSNANRYSSAPTPNGCNASLMRRKSAAVLIARGDPRRWITSRPRRVPPETSSNCNARDSRFVFSNPSDGPAPCPKFVRPLCWYGFLATVTSSTSDHRGRPPSRARRRP